MRPGFILVPPPLRVHDVERVLEELGIKFFHPLLPDGAEQPWTSPPPKAWHAMCRDVMPACYQALEKGMVIVIDRVFPAGGEVIFGLHVSGSLEQTYPRAMWYGGEQRTKALLGANTFISGPDIQSVLNAFRADITNRRSHAEDSQDQDGPQSRRAAGE